MAAAPVRRSVARMFVVAASLLSALPFAHADDAPPKRFQTLGTLKTHQGSPEQAGKFAALAYSSATGEYGWSTNRDSRAEAEREALARCKGADRRIVGWVGNGYLALAIGMDGYYGVGWRYGEGAKRADATDVALKELHKRSPTGELRLLVELGSDNDGPHESF